MDHNSISVGRQRRPSLSQNHLPLQGSRSLNPMAQPPADQGDLTVLSAARFSGFKSKNADEERLEDPFAHGSTNRGTARSRGNSPMRGGITPPDYQRKTNPANNRLNGITAAAASRIGTPAGVPRPRMSSVKDRVAMFESKPGEEPNKPPSRPSSRPPSRPSSRPPSRPTSAAAQRTKPAPRPAPLPKVSATSKVLQPHVNSLARPDNDGQRSPKKLTKDPRIPVPPKTLTKPPPKHLASQTRASRSMNNLTRGAQQENQSQPLFGETFALNTGPGFGIPSSHQRSGSEGSPVLSSTPRFSEDDAESSEGFARGSTGGKSKHSGNGKLHRRVKSDQVNNTSENINLEVPKPWMTSEVRKSTRSGSDATNKPGSKIPVRPRRGSRASDSAESMASSRASSATGRHPPRTSTPLKGQRVTGPQSSNSRGLTISPLPGHSSPNRRDRNGTNTHLTASIIAPPPKVSPPLRSSRPRQPIWMASTAASRAKAGETNSRDSSPNPYPRSRSKPPKKFPELQSVDFAARRSKIISASAEEQARQTALAAERLRLAKEREEKEEEQRRKQEELKASLSLQTGEQDASSNIDDESADEESDVFETPVEDFNKGDHTLTIDTKNLSSPAKAHPMRPREINKGELDSPTLGGPAPFQRISAPQSAASANGKAIHMAIPAEVEGTPIDTEPQVEFPDLRRPPHKTILSQIMQMRHPSVLPTNPAESGKSDHDSQSDMESVQFVLRKSADLNEPNGLGLVPGDVGNQSQLTPSSKSWTSSIEDESADDLSRDEQKIGSGPPMGLALLSRAIADSPVPQSSAQVEGRPLSVDIHHFVDDQGHLVEAKQPEEYSHPAEFNNRMYTTTLSGSAQSGWSSQRASEDYSDITHEEHSQEILQPLNQWNHDEDHVNHDDVVDFETTDNGHNGLGLAHDENNRELHLIGSTSKPDLQILNFRASLIAREDFEDASPSRAQWSHFTRDMDVTTDISASEDEDVPPAPPPKDDDFSDRATTPRAVRASLLPSIQSVSQDSGVHIRVQSPSKSMASVSSQPPPLPAHSPPPPPIDPLLRQRSRPSIESLSHGQVFSPNGLKMDSDHFGTQTENHVDQHGISTGSIGSGSESLRTKTSSLRGSSLYRFNTASSSDVLPEHRRPSLDTYGDTLNEGRQSTDTSPSTLINENRPSIESRQSTLGEPRPDGEIRKASPSPAQKKLNKRRHILREIVDTEFSYNRDMTVVVDIYKATAGESVKMSKDDERTLFGNAEEVVKFSSEFLQDLKDAVRDVYEMSRTGRKASDRMSGVTSSSNTLADDASSMPKENSDEDRDAKTRVGAVFKKHLEKMESVYSPYTRNHEASNKTLQSLCKIPEATFWMKECAKESSDLTSAWDLGSLLVKPVQRFLKYPLLLEELCKVTEPSHADHQLLKESLDGVRDMAIRINERKKQAEIVNNVVRKRKESTVTGALSKAFGRRTEKLKQQVGLSEYVEDRAYDVIKGAHIENRTMLLLVRQDIEQHVAYVDQAMRGFSNFLAEIEGWGSVGADLRENPEYKNKWLSIRKVVKELQTIALPAYIAHVSKTILAPMDKTIEYLQALEKGILAKRDSRLLDYSRYRNLKQRGSKMDKKTQELGEEYLALNKEAKQRMGNLLTSTKNLIGLCLQNLVRFEGEWWQTWGDKFQWITDNKEFEDYDSIVRDWNGEWSIFEAHVLSLALCNGALLADTANMANFQARSPSFSADSPRQTSMSEAVKRSVSIDGSPSLYPNSMASPPMTEMANNKSSPFLAGRLRASSTNSGGRTSNTTLASSSASTRRPISVNTSGSGERRPATSTSAEPSPRLPRLSLEAPSPSLGPFPVNFTMRPTPEEPSQGPFSSAMPMAESPIAPDLLRYSGPEEHEVLFLAASVYEFNIDRSRREAGFPYLTYISGEIFDVIGERGELWLARNQDDPSGLIGWIWNKHFVKLAT